MDVDKASKRLIADLANLKPDTQATESLKSKYDLDANDERVLFLRDLAQRLWGGGDQGGIEILRNLLLPKDGLPMVGIDWNSRGFSYEPQNRIQGAFYYLLQNAHLAKRCGNTKCLRPFFLGERANERYCSDRCFDEAQKTIKRDWWEEHSDEVRQYRRKKPEKTELRRKKL